MSDWPHAPLHRLNVGSTYMVTAGTYLRRPPLTPESHRTLVRDHLFALALEYGWDLQAWAILRNHYHLVAATTGAGDTLGEMLGRLHGLTSRLINQADGRTGRKVWYQFRDTVLTNERSYFARLKYVHLNPAHHGLVRNAEHYPWCSASWFALHADQAFYGTVMSFPVDRLRVWDIDGG